MVFGFHFHLRFAPTETLKSRSLQSSDQLLLAVPESRLSEPLQMEHQCSGTVYPWTFGPPHPSLLLNLHEHRKLIAWLSPNGCDSRSLRVFNVLTFCCVSDVFHVLICPGIWVQMSFINKLLTYFTHILGIKLKRKTHQVRCTFTLSKSLLVIFLALVAANLYKNYLQ